MDNAFYYWQLMRLRSSGQSQVQVNLEVQAWLQERFPQALLDPDSPDSQLQRQLWSCWRGQEQDADLAALSLRCFMSHQIHQACLTLAQRYGERYGLSLRELWAVVLDDEGKCSPVYRPFSLEILESYDPNQSSLSTWTRQLTYNHPELNRVLLESGIYRASDWAILNDTNADQLERILRDYHVCSQYELEQALRLLQQYQAVYRRDRLSKRRLGHRGPCQTPTEEQLQQMYPTVSSLVVLKRLKHLAGQLREYRVHVRGGNPRFYQPQDEQELETLVGQQPGNWGTIEDESEGFLTAYRQALKETLAGAIAQVLKANLERLRRRKQGRDKTYLEALHLSQCQGLSMTEIAPKIGLTSQVQVTRLLNLKRLRLEVRHLLISQLYQRLTQEALKYIPIERLHAIDETLETLLTELVDEMMAESAAQTQSAQPCQQISRFNAALCHAICPLRQRFK